MRAFHHHSSYCSSPVMSLKYLPPKRKTNHLRRSTPRTDFLSSSSPSQDSFPLPYSSTIHTVFPSVLDSFQRLWFEGYVSMRNNLNERVNQCVMYQRQRATLYLHIWRLNIESIEDLSECEHFEKYVRTRSILGIDANVSTATSSSSVEDTFFAEEEVSLRILNGAALLV